MYLTDRTQATSVNPTDFIHIVNTASTFEPTLSATITLPVDIVYLKMVLPSPETANTDGQTQIIEGISCTGNTDCDNCRGITFDNQSGNKQTI